MSRPSGSVCDLLWVAWRGSGRLWLCGRQGPSQFRILFCLRLERKMTFLRPSRQKRDQILPASTLQKRKKTEINENKRKLVPFIFVYFCFFRFGDLLFVYFSFFLFLFVSATSCSFIFVFFRFGDLFFVFFRFCTPQVSQILLLPRTVPSNSVSATLLQCVCNRGSQSKAGGWLGVQEAMAVSRSVAALHVADGPGRQRWRGAELSALYLQHRHQKADAEHEKKRNDNARNEQKRTAK